MMSQLPLVIYRYLPTNILQGDWHDQYQYRSALFGLVPRARHLEGGEGKRSTYGKLLSIHEEKATPLARIL